MQKINDFICKLNKKYTTVLTTVNLRCIMKQICDNKGENMEPKTDIVIVGTGVAGLFCAINLPDNLHITIITKSSLEESDSFLAQGGICMMQGPSDYDTYFEDTMRAGHYENRKESVDIMLNSSETVINDLMSLGVEFEKDENGKLKFTREGAHSVPRICYHEDITGQEITSKLLAEVKRRNNIVLLEHTEMIDITEVHNQCTGIIVRNSNGIISKIDAKFTMLATGGIGGLFENSTNYPHLTADSLAIAIKHNIELENIDYIQIHPTTLYSKKKGRRFLISESVRGEGAILLNNDMHRFTDELQPRDVVTAAIKKQMEIDNMPYVWLSLETIPKEIILKHFPNIYKKCLEEGYDVTQECIPVVPAQHYFMGGIKVDKYSKTSMDCLYSAGETSCNGVHGKNRLASNSLLEGLVFAKRAAHRIAEEFNDFEEIPSNVNPDDYIDCDINNKDIVLNEIKRRKRK